MFLSGPTTQVTLILEPYREFISELAIDLLSPEDLEVASLSVEMIYIL